MRILASISIFINNFNTINVKDQNFLGFFIYPPSTVRQTLQMCSFLFNPD